MRAFQRITNISRIPYISIFLSIVLIIFLTVVTGYPATWYVAANGNDNSGTGSQIQPWRTIQHAALNASAGDTVLIDNGTYDGFYAVNSGTAAQPITFRANGDRVILHPAHETAPECIGISNRDYLVIDGLTITGSPGIGVAINDSQGVTVQNCSIEHNQAIGILAVWAPEIRILDNEISNNQLGGIDIENSRVSDDNPVIRSNYIHHNGGWVSGIRINADSSAEGDGLISGAEIEKNVIHDNAQLGLGVNFISDSTISNNVIYNNCLEPGPGGILMLESHDNLIENNTIVEPRSIAVWIVDGAVNNVLFNNICISNEPHVPLNLQESGNKAHSTSNLLKATAEGLFVNPEAGDFHLTAASLAIDMGQAAYAGHRAPSDDCEGATRPHGRGYDIGAFEYRGPTGHLPARIQVPADQPTIQAAIAAAQSGDEIIVHPGTYSENIDFLDKTITVKSTDPDDPAVVAATIIDGGRAGSVVTLNGNGTLDGLTVQNGQARSGGGVICNQGGSPSITNCIIRRNSAEVEGGGIRSIYSSPTIANCTIIENSIGSIGGGISCTSSSPVITNCLIAGNRAYIGGGIDCCGFSLPTITNCTIVGNSAGAYGGGIFVEYSSWPIITNCILWNDSPDEIYQNPNARAAITYCDIQGGFPGAGNINRDPLFVNPEAGDYHLRNGSAGIDAATSENVPAADREGNSRPIGAGYDMGAYEYGSSGPGGDNEGPGQELQQCREDDSGVIDIGGARGRVGDEIHIPVRIQAAPREVGAFGFEVTYEADQLEYRGFEPGALVSSFDMVDVHPLGSGRLRVAGISPRTGIPQGASGALLSLTFRVVNGRENECYPLRLENGQDYLATFALSGGCFCIQSCNGDIDRNGEVTPADALIAFQCYLGKGPCPECSDVDQNGTVTPLDAFCLFRKYLGMPSCLDEQQGEATGTIQGVVRNTQTNYPVEGAMVAIEGTDIQTATNNQGEFLAENVPAGSRTITISAPGYLPESRSITVTPGTTATTTAAFSLTLQGPLREALIVDHTCTDLSLVPAEWIEAAKANLKVWHAHTVHGGQITTGMSAMADSLYRFHTSEETLPGSLSYQELQGADLGHHGDLAWRETTIDLLNRSGNERNVIVWSWEGGVSDNTTEGINAYLQAMDQLEREYPQVIFIYMTGHVDGTGIGGNSHARNNQIREFCRVNEKILFDFADLESFNPDGQYYLDHSLEDDGHYYDDTYADYRNWVEEWCWGHPCPSDEGDPIYPFICSLKARAFWWMLARLAGWNEPTPAVQPRLGVHPGRLAFASAPDGANPDSQSFIITTSNGVVLPYRVSADTDWLQVSPSQGMLTSEGNAVSVSVDTTGLGDGTHTGTITITAEGADASPQTIPVSVPINAETGRWELRGIGGGGSFYSPSMSPHDPQDMYVATDMSTVFHTDDFGRSWESYHFKTLQGDINSHVRFTSSPSVLYALDWGDLVRTPVKSTDQGKTWRPLATDPTAKKTFSFHADPTSTGRLLIADRLTLFFSSNGGLSFHPVYTTPNQDKCLHIGGAFWDGDNIFVGTSDGLLVSSDGGISFAPSSIEGIPDDEIMISFTGAKEGADVRFFAVTVDSAEWSERTTGMQWFTYNDMVRAFYQEYRGVYRLDWGRGNWTKTTTGISASARPYFVAMSLNNRDVAYLAGWGDVTVNFPGVYKTTDGGNTWIEVFQTRNNQNIATGYGGNGGDYEWLASGAPSDLAVSPIDPDRAMITDALFVHVTDDGGASWRQAYVDPAYQNPAGSLTPRGRYYSGNGLEVTGSYWIHWIDQSKLMVGFADIKAILSIDGGQTWKVGTSLGLPPGIWAVNHIIEHPDTHALYAATSAPNSYHFLGVGDGVPDIDGHVIMSQDEGQTWQSIRNFAHPVAWLVIDPDNPDTLYASVIHGEDGGIYVTHNLSQGTSASWSRLNNPPRTEGRPFYIHLLKDGTLIATFSAHNKGNQAMFTESSGVFSSTDGGMSWEDLSHINMRRWTRDLVIDPHDPTQNTWYVTVFTHWGGGEPYDVGGIYRTTDRGRSWSRLLNLRNVVSVTIHPDNPDILYASTGGQGLWYTDNLTSSAPQFSRVEDYPFKYPVRAFFNPYNHNEIWVTNSGGALRVYRQPQSPSDTEPPTNPVGLTAQPVSSSQINLSWSPSTGNEGVAGYRIYRDGKIVAPTVNTFY